MVRKPVVSDRFYPASPALLRRELEHYLDGGAGGPVRSALAVIVPHAGYVYSGAVAGETFARVRIPETVLIAGPNHTGAGRPLALGISDWSMPLGPVPIQRRLATLILRESSLVEDDDLAHAREHSLEVQVPFLQFLQEKLSIVPLVVGRITLEQCRRVARDLARAILAFDEPVLLVASTDMTHYLPRSQARAQDHLALDRILDLDGQGLFETVHEHRITMCGVVPTVIVLFTARELGAARAELVRYADSGEVSGDTEQVVGYAGVIVS